MEMTWLDFQLPTDNQNDRKLTTNFFFDFKKKKFFETWCVFISFWGPRVLALFVFMRDGKRGYSAHLYFSNFNKSFLFSVKSLETWHIMG